MKPKESHLKQDGDISSEKRKIFIVDDDTSVSCALGVLLISYGFTVETFTSAKDFFHAVPNSVPGCLILDIHMPKLDGWEALRRIVKSGSKRQVIVISADKTSVSYEKAIEAGAAGYLQKPFNDRELVDFIKEALKNISKDFKELKAMLYDSVSFMDRVDSTGVLKKKTAEDLGISGLRYAKEKYKPAFFLKKFIINI